jgi:hypothetical protein
VTDADADAPPVATRRATLDDVPAIVDLATATLGWVPGEPHAELFTWKHHESPFGQSLIWLAEDDQGLVGVRTFLRWRWVDERGRTFSAVRAVDTATHPRTQGRGIFTHLTRLGLDDLEAEGVDFVLNTPNDQSRPGNLKLGWQPVGRPPIGVRPRSLTSLVRMVRARVPAQKWSMTDAPGEPAAEVLADADAVAGLLDRLPPPAGLTTARSPEFLAWRYRFGPLAYRVWRAGRSLDDGVCIFRLRRRGAAVEATICDVLLPDGPGRSRAAARLLREVSRATGADYLIATRSGATGSSGLVPLPRQGPLLVHRPVGDPAAARPIDAWRVAMGDLELF